MRIGLETPEDVAVVGHADYPIATQISPKVTTLHMPHRQLGIAAVRVLLSRAGRSTSVTDTAPMRISLVPNLVERQTTARDHHLLGATSFGSPSLQGAAPADRLEVDRVGARISRASGLAGTDDDGRRRWSTAGESSGRGLPRMDPRMDLCLAARPPPEG